ncbi:HAD family hydrolase [Paenibacillus daejeonensis]|uniref:HAD family hydrolase n=1 Tax=Paenibacillus daejeonensis TaxID=135193 RepID=UPI00035DB533|nr:HAD family hydrolase [Paenibacillus daejeonensis]
MAVLRMKEQTFEVDLVIFDKDGLLFDARYFWQRLAEARMRVLQPLLGEAGLTEWCELMGITHTGLTALDIDPAGIFALAPPQEEIIVTASLLKVSTGGDWGVARERAAAAFRQSDEQFDLQGALEPKRGFPDIFCRLQQAAIPFGIATSDDYDRTIRSVGRHVPIEWLTCIVTPVDVERGKPHPDMLELISRTTGVPLPRIAMIGDSFVDVAMASAAGSIGIGIPDDPVMAERMLPCASIIIESLDDILIETAAVHI